MSEPAFTKEELKSIAPIDNASVSPAGLMVCNLAAFALSQMERAEKAEAERDRLRACVKAADARIATLRRLAFDTDMDCLSQRAELLDMEATEAIAYAAAHKTIEENL